MTRRRSTPQGVSRGRRVDEVIREVVAEALVSMGDPALRDVTVTGVSSSKDHQVADVFVQLHGNPVRRAKALERLDAARGLLQARINQEMHLRRTPVLRFREDVASETGARIEALVKEPPLLPEDPE